MRKLFICSIYPDDLLIDVDIAVFMLAGRIKNQMRAFASPLRWLGIK